jgi:hypothetical protein
MPWDMTNTSRNNPGHKLSAVVAFRSRDLVEPKGIDAGEILARASAEELLAHHVDLARDAKAFWKDGFLLYTLWATGDSCGMIPHGRRSALYPYTRTGFYQFLHDHGSQISPEEGSRRIKVFRAYNRFEVTIIRMVEKAGIWLSRTSKATRSGICCSCALRRRITAYGLHCRTRIPNLLAVASAAVSPGKIYAGPLSAVRCR